MLETERAALAMRPAEGNHVLDERTPSSKIARNFQRSAEIEARQAKHIRDLRIAGALVREGDWRGVRDQFEGHPFGPLAKLSGAAADTLLCFPPEDIGPDQILVLTWPPHRDEIADLFGIFGV